MELAWTLVILSAIVLISYLFDLASKRLRIPSVVLLIVSGMLARVATDSAGFILPLSPQLLPVLGTFGLLLIVLEGALDLELSRNKTGLISRSFASAAAGLLVTALLCSLLLQSFFGVAPLTAWIVATPFAVISSAVAIPAAGSLPPRLREFVVYESSFSDILGVLLFYALISSNGNFADTALQSVFSAGISALVGIFAALLLYALIKHIDTHVRYLPMIFGIALLYGIGKLLHLAPLVMVLLVGLLLNNNRWMGRLPLLDRGNQAEFDEELDNLKHLTAEFTFVVRTFFFVLLGYSIRLAELLDPLAWGIAITIVACGLLPRLLLMRFIARGNIEPLLWFAPRGLITVLLFLGIPASMQITDFPFASVMLVVLIWAGLLTLGLVRAPAQAKTTEAATPVSSTPAMPTETPS